MEEEVASTEGNDNGGQTISRRLVKGLGLESAGPSISGSKVTEVTGFLSWN